MVTPEALEVGKTYFTVFYADQSLLAPVIETFVYLGAESRTDEGYSSTEHVFQQARSFHQVGNWNSLASAERAQFEVVPLLMFAPGDLEPVTDLEGLIAELGDLLKRSQ